MADLGRPSKLTPAIREKIVQALSLGCHRKQAAAFAGIDERTFRRWMRDGLQPDTEPYTSFREAVEEAEAKCQVAAVGCITKAARDGDYRAAAWLLERRCPELYSPRSRLHDPYRVLEILDDAGLVADHEKALTALAQSGAGLPQGDAGDDDLDDIDLTEEQRTALFDELHATRVRARVVGSRPPGEPARPEDQADDEPAPEDGP